MSVASRGTAAQPERDVLRHKLAHSMKPSGAKPRVNRLRFPELAVLRITFAARGYKPNVQSKLKVGDRQSKAGTPK